MGHLERGVSAESELGLDYVCLCGHRRGRVLFVLSRTYHNQNVQCVRHTPAYINFNLFLMRNSALFNMCKLTSPPPLLKPLYMHTLYLYPSLSFPLSTSLPAFPPRGRTLRWTQCQINHQAEQSTRSFDYEANTIQTHTSCLPGPYIITIIILTIIHFTFKPC